ARFSLATLHEPTRRLYGTTVMTGNVATAVPLGRPDLRRPEFTHFETSVRATVDSPMVETRRGSNDMAQAHASAHNPRFSPPPREHVRVLLRARRQLPAKQRVELVHEALGSSREMRVDAPHEFRPRWSRRT